MSTRTSLARTARQLHLYLGVFVAPALLFFAFTGALQTFSLHEKPWGNSSQPPHWVLVLARLHKDQTIVLPPPRAPRHAESAAPAPAVAGAAAGHADPHVDVHAGDRSAAKQASGARPAMASRLPMKLFFLVVTLTLFASVVTGLYMAFTYKRNKLALAFALAAGVVVPLLLLFV